jgi:Pentapeptide repeats (8 copies)
VDTDTFRDITNRPAGMEHEANGLILIFLGETPACRQDGPLRLLSAAASHRLSTRSGTVHLSEGNFTRAHLAGANLTDAHINVTNLTNADLTGANLTNADLTGANLTGVKLANVKGTPKNATVPPR